LTRRTDFPQNSPVTLPHHFPGFLIVIEGIDGAGKTTQAHHVQDALQAQKLAVIRTKEPTAGHWGQVLRDSALTGRLSIEEEVEAFIKDRKEHVEQTINPALREGKIVIVDRYYFSTAAYQGARGVDPDELIRRNEEFAPEPDLLVLLDIDPKAGLERIRTRGDRANHFEKTGTLRSARDIFLSIKKPYLLRIDATQQPGEICNLIMRKFWALHAERTAKSNTDPKEKLNATLDVFGADPV
jgi:dTMP kinase